MLGCKPVLDRLSGCALSRVPDLPRFAAPKKVIGQRNSVVYV
jgi:hypothetical protein